MFSDLWRDDFLQVISKVRRWALQHLGLEPYSQVLLSWGLKLWVEWGERDKMLDWAMEYTRAVGVELADMLASVNSWVLDQHTFGSDSLHQYIQDH